MTANTEVLARIDAALTTHEERAVAVGPDHWTPDFDRLAPVLRDARAEIVRQAAEVERLTTPPTADEREALARVIGDSGSGGQSAWAPEYADPSWEFMRDMDRRAADAILASPVWRNRHRGPITDEEKDRLISDVLTYGHIEGLSLRGHVQAAVRMTLEAARGAEAGRTEQSGGTDHTEGITT